MAKWEGGRGTIAYNVLPADIAEAVKGMRPKPRTATAPELRATPPPVKAAPQPAAAAAAIPTAAAESATVNVRKIVGEVFIGGGESQSVRVKFAAVPVVAYPLEEAKSALDTNLTPTLPPPSASVETDSEGRFEIELPNDARFMLIVKGRHRALRGGRITDWEWRVLDSDISGNRVMLHDANAFSSPRNQGTVQRR